MSMHALFSYMICPPNICNKVCPYMESWVLSLVPKLTKCQSVHAKNLCVQKYYEYSWPSRVGPKAKAEKLLSCTEVFAEAPPIWWIMCRLLANGR